MAIDAPIRGDSFAISIPESASACREAATTICAKRSIRRACLRSIQTVGSKSFSSAAKCTGNSLASNCWMSAAPDSPAIRFDHEVSTSFPSGVTIPSPVTTTRRLPLSPATYIPSPPSTSNTSPVMNEAASEQRKRTAPATSSGSPSRPSGVFSSIAPVASSGSTSVSCVFT